MIADDRRTDDIAGASDAELMRRLIESDDAHEPAPVNERLVRAAFKPIADEDREALRRLIAAGTMIRRACGNYGNKRETMIINSIAARLKKRGLAIPGFNKELVASLKGKQIMADEEHAAR